MVFPEILGTTFRPSRSRAGAVVLMKVRMNHVNAHTMVGSLLPLAGDSRTECADRPVSYGQPQGGGDRRVGSGRSDPDLTWSLRPRGRRGGDRAANRRDGPFQLRDQH